MTGQENLKLTPTTKLRLRLRLLQMRHESTARRRDMLIAEMERERKHWVQWSLGMKGIVAVCIVRAYQGDHYVQWGLVGAGTLLLYALLHWRMVLTYRSHRDAMRWLNHPDDEK